MGASRQYSIALTADSSGSPTPGIYTSQRSDMPHLMGVLRPQLIAGLVVTEVAIWQWRMVIADREGRVSAMLLGIVGAVLRITASRRSSPTCMTPSASLPTPSALGSACCLALWQGRDSPPE